MLRVPLFGIQIECHIGIFILLATLAFVGSGLFGVVCIAFSIVHEMAHSIVARKLGYTPVSISFGIFGGMLHLRETFLKPNDALWILIAGPFANLLFASAFYGIAIFFPLSIFYTFASANTLLALFNLLPVYPLDGGNLIETLLTKVFNRVASIRLSQVFSTLFSVLLFIFGIYMVQYNLLNLLICLLAINLFITGRMDRRYNYNKLLDTYKILKEENHIWY